MSFYQIHVNQVSDSARRIPPPDESLNLSEDTVISYNKKGDPASVFSDDIWNFSAISIQKK